LDFGENEGQVSSEQIRIREFSFFIIYPTFHKTNAVYFITK